MNVSLVQVGQNTYVNPQHITRIEESCDIENSSWVHTVDGKYVETGEGFTPAKIVKAINDSQRKLDIQA